MSHITHPNQRLSSNTERSWITFHSKSRLYSNRHEHWSPCILHQQFQCYRSSIQEEKGRKRSRYRKDPPLLGDLPRLCSNVNGCREGVLEEPYCQPGSELKVLKPLSAPLALGAVSNSWLSPPYLLCQFLKSKQWRKCNLNPAKPTEQIAPVGDRHTKAAFFVSWTH